METLSKSKITINSGIFTFAKNNGSIYSVKEFYKTGENSDIVFVNEFLDPPILSKW